MRIFTISVTIVIFFAISLAVCNGNKMNEEKFAVKSLSDVTPAAWVKLAHQTIYFGHQSVGENIIAGIRVIMKEHPEIKLHIVETTDLAAFRSPVFANSPIGKNGAPLSKINEFKELMDKGMGNLVNIAFFKFCFDDIRERTNVEMLFKNYSQTMDDLTRKYSKTQFVYITVPLLKRQKRTLASRIKGFFGGGKGYFADENNIARYKLNKLIRKKYKGSGLLFDLARLESTKPDGTRESFEKKGKIYYALAPAYTGDGGHLNVVGRKYIAQQLLIFLANM
ncbi:hypothetical protein MNBD_DELTA04-1625 [hydrothermal vent metagenome]|uniref:SGNH/GDSL hydrolase family protein n=1 Tax=hydrothermal vent metagenome TaxID=652676 RepID=A0A3B0UU60_9ZZZZ